MFKTIILDTLDKNTEPVKWTVNVGDIVVDELTGSEVSIIRLIDDNGYHILTSSYYLNGWRYGWEIRPIDSARK